MVIILPSTSSSSPLLSSNKSPLTSHSPPHKSHAPPRIISFATPDPNSSDPPKPDPNTEGEDFDNRISNLRLRYKSGTGKKAEVRKGKKPTKKTSNGGGSSAGVFLPPVALKEPVSDSVKVEFGFSPYSERINGRIAGLGLTALVLVELASGESVIRFHTPSIIFVQLYFVAAVSAMFIKVQKESVSVWPQSQIKN